MAADSLLDSCVLLPHIAIISFVTAMMQTYCITIARMEAFRIRPPKGTMMRNKSSIVEVNGDMKQPNFIMIYCDDLGYGDLGCYGSTP